MESPLKLSELPRFSLRSLLVGVSAIALLLAAFRSGSIAGFVVVLIISVLVIGHQTYRSVWTLPCFRVFSTVFSLIGWIGLVTTLTARFPISGVNIIRSMKWHLETADASWFDFYGSAALGMSYLCSTLLLGCIGGLVALSIYSALRTPATHPNQEDESHG